MSVLSDRINQLRNTPTPGASSSSSSSSAVLDPPSSSSGLAGIGNSALAGRGSSGSSSDDATKSFSDADDDELSAALGQRIKQIATTTGEWGSSMDEQEMRQPLTGEVSVQTAMGCQLAP